ncbi:C6 transcription factor [Ophiocordyceps camponoti-floridani]|uniref:C6 transcription factor n=1 Tax=Ophiocordyceps camponoti-floridani TaxID=2030778 RepID=A0A8H4QBA4_9HYPO|nr:C6 transcription factor [Ophiocordyceps camponoti-floridani]
MRNKTMMMGGAPRLVTVSGQQRHLYQQSYAPAQAHHLHQRRQQHHHHRQQQMQNLEPFSVPESAPDRQRSVTVVFALFVSIVLADFVPVDVSIYITIVLFLASLNLSKGIVIDLPVSLLPAHGHGSYELLSYYLSRTANSMGNGSTDVNPFIAKLVPMAFSNSLVLQLLLAQSAAHRQQASNEPPEAPGTEIAQQYYTESLRLFRTVVGDFVSGKEDHTLTLTVGSLILCLTEVARGDVYGSILDHLSASRALLTMLLDRPDLTGDLVDFLVEFYMHTVASSIIATDPRGSPARGRSQPPPPLSPAIEQTARALVARHYVGQLCGCWLELLLLIPQVFQLGQALLPAGGGIGGSAGVVDAEALVGVGTGAEAGAGAGAGAADSVPTSSSSSSSQKQSQSQSQSEQQQQQQQQQPTADDIITFGFLQSQILAFYPPPTASLHSQLAGLVFKQGALLYLWSILGTTSSASSPNSALADLIDGAVAEAASLLSQFPASARVNTSLCWPLAVVGCCTADKAVRAMLRQRLQTMIETFGLGNMRETLALLEHVWRQPEMSPWTLHRSMREHQIWISFA